MYVTIIIFKKEAFNLCVVGITAGLQRREAGRS